MHLLLDFIKEVRDDGTVSAVQLKIDTLCGTLDAMNLRPGEHVRSFCAEITDDNMFKETHLTRVDGDAPSYATTVNQNLSHVPRNTFARDFPIFSRILSSLEQQIQATPCCGQERGKTSSSFGENKLTGLIHHFQALLIGLNFDDQACLDEWLELKLLVYRQPELREQSVQHFWSHMSTAYGNEFANMLMVVELCLIIPVQTACVERDNSCLNRIMTDHRASLDVPTISALMHIAINGPSHEEYDATRARAVACWLTSGERRRKPEYLDRNRRDAEKTHFSCNFEKWLFTNQCSVQWQHAGICHELVLQCSHCLSHWIVVKIVDYLNTKHCFLTPWLTGCL